MMFGSDFFAARRGALYGARNGQPLWLVGLQVIGVFLLLSFLQGMFGLAISFLLPADAATVPADGSPMAVLGLSADAYVKGMLLGLLPSSLIAALAAWAFAGLGNKSGDRGIPLHLPKLGAGGFLVIVIGLVVVMMIVYSLTFWVLGIDPATYQPGKDGLSDMQSQAGLVEKAMADLAAQPFLFALALPGVTVAVPIVEEIIFRGALFSALRNSWFGKTGAVVLTAALWSLAHGFAAPWLFVFIIFVMGLCLGWLLLRFGSLWVTIACHCAWNLVSSLAIFGMQVPT